MFFRIHRTQKPYSVWSPLVCDECRASTVCLALPQKIHHRGHGWSGLGASHTGAGALWGGLSLLTSERLEALTALELTGSDSMRYLLSCGLHNRKTLMALITNRGKWSLFGASPHFAECPGFICRCWTSASNQDRCKPNTFLQQSKIITGNLWRVLYEWK